jgi:hypothetical protein
MFVVEQRCEDKVGVKTPLAYKRTPEPKDTVGVALIVTGKTEPTATLVALSTPPIKIIPAFCESVLL